MGAGANHGRRAVLEKVHECVDLANGCSRRVNEVEKAHNALVDGVKVDIARLERQIQDITFERMKAAKEFATHKDSELRATLRTEIRAAVAENNRSIEAAFAALTFRQRLRVAFTGRVVIQEGTPQA